MLPCEPNITLEDAKRLVTCLEQGDTETANDILEQTKQSDSEKMFSQVGQLTRKLHDSLNGFQVDERLSELATASIPDAKDRLAYVIEMTDKSANKTMDAVENCLPLAENLSDSISKLIPNWDKLMHRKIELAEFKSLCHGVDDLLKQADHDSATLKAQLTDVLMAQDFQDLTGQVISKVIELVKEVEDNLVHLLTAFADTEEANQPQAKLLDKEVEIKKTAQKKEGPEGPIIDADKRNDAVAGQDEVDDLLSSLGF